MEMVKWFENEVKKLQSMIDNPDTQDYLNKKVEEIEEINKASYNTLRMEQR